MTIMQTPLWQISVRVPYAVVDGCVALFENEKFLGISWMECDDSAPLEILDDNGFPIASEFQIDAFASTKPDLAFIQSALSCVCDLGNIAHAPQVLLSPVDDTDWLSACYTAMPAQTYGDFYVYGSHIKDPCPAHLLPVLVDAATAFGSGEHPTTAGCLTMLSRICSVNTFVSVLDMGCGSGILGIAAKKKIPNARVILADFDPESVRVSAQNATLNHVDIVCVESLGFNNPMVAQHGPFDLILANILAKPLCELASPFAKQCIDGAHVILSGLLTRHGDMIQEHYENAGFHLIDTLVINDWLTMLFRK